MKRFSIDPEFGLPKTSRIAKGYLEAPHSIPKAERLDSWRFVARLWHYPSFHENRSWSIYERYKPSSRQTHHMVRQVTWDLAVDGERWNLPLVGLEKGLHLEPTIEVRDRPLHAEFLDGHLNSLRRIAFPAFAASPTGIDGESFGVELHDSGTKVEWWCQGPESWSELATWAEEMRSWLTTVAMEPPNSSL